MAHHQKAVAAAPESRVHVSKPQALRELVADLQGYAGLVAMAGDGINDAPPGQV